MFLRNFIQKIDDTVSIKATLQEVVNKMVKNHLHHIVILNENKPIGIISEPDVVKFYSNKVDFSNPAIKYATIDIIKLHSSRLVEYALGVMLNHNIRKIIVINTDEIYEGCVEQEELIYALEERIQHKKLKLHNLTNLSNKSILIDENTTLKIALETMTLNHLTSLLTTRNNEVIGIISESDIIKLAQSNMNQNMIVKDFMHTPLITIEESKTTEDMINLMQKNRIRRVVVHSSIDNQYYTLSSKDITSTIKGSYTSFLESKVYDIRDTFNTLSEYIIELIEINEEQIVFWANLISKENFNIHLDDNITKLIPKEKWSKIHNTLLENKTLDEIIEINGNYYQLKGHYGMITNDKIIKLFFNDITEIIQLNKKLKEEITIKNDLIFNQTKMVQMGEMISHIAHQWRQPLSVISTIASGIAIEKQYNNLNENELIPKMDVVVDNAKYLSETIDTFRNFLKEKKELKQVSIQEIISRVIQLTNASLINAEIELMDNIDYENTIFTTLVVGELEQVLINIINNAKDALVSKNIKKKLIILNLSQTKDTILITIEDNAGGIAQNILPNIFEEYFTTKENTHGTGLGLYMSHKIITESCKGKLYAQNTDNGAKFYIELPITDKV